MTERLDDRQHRRMQELEEEVRSLKEASRLTSETLANLSHDLRTPLNAITGFAEMMHDGKVGPVSPDQKEFLGDILTSSHQILDMIDAGMDRAKAESDSGSD
jgi:signal transduction histidine kinase